MYEIPRIDIAPFRRGSPADKVRVAREFGAAFENIGFATIVGHGVPDELVRRTYDTARAFFDLPLEEKMQSAQQARVKTRGYFPLGIESVALTRNEDKPYDLCEALIFSTLMREAADLAPGTISPEIGNIVPRRPAGLYPIYRGYFQAMHELVDTLMHLSALALDLPEDYFAPFIDVRRGTLRTVEYPNQIEEPKPGQLRYGAHSDYGGLTILRQDAAPGGLQACTVTGDWIDVMPTPESFVINVGDLMARWTNDRWRSTVHRVANPPSGAGARSRRQSIAFFCHPNFDAVVSAFPSCVPAGAAPRYEPILAGRHMRAKMEKRSA
jgi:isopenicillin N synthase-like dioxygenase